MGAAAMIDWPKVLYLTPGCFDKGGISRYSRYQIQALRAVCGEQNVRALSLLAPDAEAFEEAFVVHWHSQGRPGALTKIHRAAFAARGLTQALAWQPDIVHAAHVNLGPLATTIARVCGAVTALNVYGLEIWSGLRPRRRAAMMEMDHVISDCHFTGRYVTQEGLHRHSPHVIWDPVDLERFSPGPVDHSVLRKYGIPLPDDHFVVMSLGRLASAARHKGFDRLIDAVAKIAPQRPALKLVIAGRGDDRARLEALARERDVADCVHFTGSIDETDLASVYRAAHTFSLVSDRGHGRGEGIPLTPLEAMACGAAIIVGNEDGSQEAVVEGRNGFVLSPRDPTALPETLVRLMDDSQLITRLRTGARQVAQSYFSVASFVDKHRALVDEISTVATAKRRIA